MLEHIIKKNDLSFATRDRVYNDNKMAPTITATIYKDPVKVLQVGNVNPSGNGMNGQVYHENGLSPTLTTNKGEGLKIAIPCLTPDRVNKRQNGRRFKEDGEPMFTLTGQDRHGVLETKPLRLGNIYGEDKGTGFAGNVWSKEHIYPTLTTMQGGNRQPMTIIDDTQGFDGVRTYNEYSPTLRSERSGLKTVVENAQVLVKTNNSKDYDIADVGDSININQPNSTTRRGRVGHGVCQTLTTQQEYVTLTPNYRIRKLTPRECFRLMGLRDDEIDKIQQTGISNSQQYKMAGNSIVVDVLEVIFEQLLGGQHEKAIE